MPETVDLMLLGAGQLVTCRSGEKGPRRGRNLADPGLIRSGALAVSDGRLIAVGTEDEVRGFEKVKDDIRRVYADGRVVMPGWVDPHTHAVFAGYRADEYEARIRGDSYLEIDKRGGGIKRSVREVRETGEDRLFEKSRRRIFKRTSGA